LSHMSSNLKSKLKSWDWSGRLYVLPMATEAPMNTQLNSCMGFEYNKMMFMTWIESSKGEIKEKSWDYTELGAHHKDISIRRNFDRNKELSHLSLNSNECVLTSHTPNYFLFWHVIEVLEQGSECRGTMGTTSIGIDGRAAGGVVGSRRC
jgi:hypothetical protein